MLLNIFTRQSVNILVGFCKNATNKLKTLKTQLFLSAQVVLSRTPQINKLRHLSEDPLHRILPSISLEI